MIKKEHKQLVKNVEVLNRFEYKSDHRLLRMTMELKVITQKRKFFQRKTDATKEMEFRSLRKKANQMIQKDVKNFELQQLEEAIESRSSWKYAKNGFFKGKHWVPKLRDSNGILQTDRPKILEVAASFYEDLYSSRMTNEDIEKLTPILNDFQDVEEISKDELECAMLMLKNGKNRGDDGIPSELFKVCDDETIELIRKLFNEIIKEANIPKQWLESKIILIHKKGDRAKIKNYRPITKTSHFYKLFAKVILNRITKNLDDHQPPTQAGFRSGYSTTDHIFVVEQMIEKCNEFNQPLYLAFVDYNKAFDSIEQPYLWTAEHDIKDKYIRLLKEIYEGSTAKIEMEMMSRPFKISRGIKQGCCISPKEFTCSPKNYQLDRLVKIWNTNRRREIM